MKLTNMRTGEKLQFPSEIVFRELERIGLVKDGDDFCLDRLDNVSPFAWAYLWGRQDYFETWFSGEHEALFSIVLTTITYQQLRKWLDDERQEKKIDVDFHTKGNRAKERLRFVSPPEPSSLTEEISVAFGAIYRDDELHEIVKPYTEIPECLN